MDEDQNIQQSIGTSIPGTNNDKRDTEIKLLPAASLLQISQNTTQNKNSETDMEVHKHPHHVLHKKKWFEYLLEFLMIFTAVFLSFLAENKREQLVDSQREKQYINSLVQDLEQDFSRFKATVDYNETQLKKIDTAIMLLNSEQITDSVSKILYYSHLSNPYMKTMVFNQRTVTQLKAVGGFRLIAKQEVSDKIVQYTDSIEYVSWLRQEFLSALKDDRSSGFVIFNDFLIKEFRPDDATKILQSSKTIRLLTYDKGILIPYANKLKRRYEWLYAYNANLKKLQKRCIELIELARQEYQIKGGYHLLRRCWCSS